VLTAIGRGCNNIETAVQKWTLDIAENVPSRSYQIGSRLLDNPLGTTRAAVFIWRMVTTVAAPVVVRLRSRNYAPRTSGG